MNETRQRKCPNVKEFGPGNKESWDFINKLNMKCYEVVRGTKDENNLNRIIFFNTYSGNSSFEAMKNVTIPDDKYVALSVNNYDPYFFTMDNDEKSNHKFPGKSGYGKDYEESILESFKNLTAAMRMNNIEVVITEFGSRNFNNLEDRMRWCEFYLGCARDFNIKCFWWDDVVITSYAVFDRANNKFFEETEPLVNKIIEMTK
ncbi:hypothetical protein TVAG_194310 [Trichomonas vaginalis G3]|uniref:Glycoside hydrolase family 5 domain-containing protein n=1 Tax=Trichomonas vaginalis (strain ATCC PRA-98 / G3) TaxID=412133 RepID=A2ESA2_TRIV3|nr:polysaccharide catabolic process [Trichomonas vaginalis G3]EAY04466.1 hypothetical protein TVAG_194310 [Trichomonas vaginalis G3]KAI5510259.1 polysaccharide catabolic process [Trichomonas vaginalis G3]|eukprot:XP_001316689.1 hypothetical protein [Trichomonas vaginalis G3]